MNLSGKHYVIILSALATAFLHITLFPDIMFTLNGVGYLGRFGIHELLVASDPIKRCILERNQVSEILAVALGEGMRTLKQDGIEKVLQGITDMTQVRKVCVR